MSAAKKLLSVTLASTGSPRQTNRPLAPKLFEIEGQASDRSTSVSLSSIPLDSSRILTVPRSMRSSENDIERATVGRTLPASDSSRPAQFERPSASNATEKIGRDEHDIGDLDPAGEQREKSQPRRKPLGRKRRPAGSAGAQRHVGEADRAAGEQRDRGRAAQDRIKPGGRADFSLHGLAHLVRRHQRRNARQAQQVPRQPKRVRQVPNA